MTRGFAGPGPASKTQRSFEMRPIASLELDLSPNYLIKGLMPLAELLVLYGPPGSGKSFLALDAALHVAAGRPWAGCRVDARGQGVVYVASEGARGFRTRVVAAVANGGFPPDLPFALVEEAPDLGRNGDLAMLISDIEDQSDSLGIVPRLIVLDTLARSMAELSENDSQGMNTFIGNARRLSRTFGALVMPVHHSGKELDRGMRGSSALQGAADAIWCLKVEGGARRFEVEKMKDGAGGASRSFKLEKHVLGIDADGDEMSTLVVAEISVREAETVRPPHPRPRQPDAADRDLPAVFSIIEAEGTTGAGRAEGLQDDVRAMPVAALKKSLAAELRRRNPKLGHRSERTMADARIDSLLERGSLETLGGWAWPGASRSGAPEVDGGIGAEVVGHDADKRASRAGGN